MGLIPADVNLLVGPNGCDALLSGRDMSIVYGFQNMPLLALFGGNREQSTPRTFVDGEQRRDYWANSLLMPNDPQQQFNSLTERILMNVALNSSGRLQIEQAVIKDLEFMKAFAIITVDVAIVGVDKVRINIRFQKPDKLQEQVFVFIWDGTQSSLTYEAPPTQYYLGTESGGFITTESGELISLW